MAAEVEGQFAGVEAVLQQSDTRAFADGVELGNGLLSVEESNLCWSSSDGSERLVLEYPNIVIHAVSRDTSAFPHHCVYLQYVTQGSEEGEGEEEEEEVKMTEYRLVPSSTDQLDSIYQAITHCQLLYPDPEQSDSEAEEEEEAEGEGEEGKGEGEEGEEGGEIDLEGGEFFTTAEGFNHLSPEGLATLSHLERLLQLPSQTECEAMVSNGEGTCREPDEQFEDAD